MAFIGQDAVLAPSQRLWEKEQRRARRQGFRRPHLGHGAEAARQLAGKPRGPRCPLKRRRDPCRICPRSTHLRGGQRSPWHPPPRECPSTHANVRKSPAQSQGRRSRPAVTAPPVQAAPRPASRAGSLVPRLLPQCWTPPPCPSFSRLGHSAPATRVQSEVPPGPVRGGAGRERTRTRSPRRWLRGLSGKPGRGLRTRSGRRKRVGRCRAKHRSRKAERSPGRPPHAHSPLGRAAGLEDARSETDAERPPERMRTQRLAQLRLLDRSSGARMRDGPRARVGRCLAGGGGRWGDRRCCCSRCAQLAPGDSTSTSARPRSAASSRKSPTRPWSSVRRGEGGQGLRVSQTRPRRPAESGSRPEQAGRDGCVCSAGNYRTQMWDKQKEVFLPSTPGLGMHVEVKDPEGKVGQRSAQLRGTCGARDAQGQGGSAPGHVRGRSSSGRRVGTGQRAPVTVCSVAGGAVPTVWLRGPLHLHFPHARRPSDLPALQFHQDGSLCWRQTGKRRASPATSRSCPRFHQVLSEWPPSLVTLCDQGQSKRQVLHFCPTARGGVGSLAQNRESEGF